MQEDASAKRVLVIEDEPMIATLLAELLEMDGYRVFIATDPAEAELVWAREMGNVDLVFADHTLPGRCGFELARDLALLKPNLKVILMSGHDDLPLAATSIQGAFFLKKPFGMHGLQEALSRVLPAGRPALPAFA